jgi:hypothetical protein
LNDPEIDAIYNPVNFHSWILSFHRLLIPARLL